MYARQIDDYYDILGINVPSWTKWDKCPDLVELTLWKSGDQLITGLNVIAQNHTMLHAMW